MSKKHESQQIWIGLAKVNQPIGSDTLGEVDEAYVNVIGLAKTRLHFRSQVKAAVADLNLILMRLEDAEFYSERISRFDVDKDLRKIAKRVEQTGDVGFGTFHSFSL